MHAGLRKQFQARYNEGTRNMEAFEQIHLATKHASYLLLTSHHNLAYPGIAVNRLLVLHSLSLPARVIRRRRCNVALSWLLCWRAIWRLRRGF